MLVITQARVNGIFAQKGGEGEEQEQNMRDENEGDSGVTLLEGARGQGMAGCPID